MGKYEVRITENLYDKFQTAVLFNVCTADWFRNTVGIQQRWLLSPTVVYIFLERIMCEALDDHGGNVAYYQFQLCK